MADADSDPDTDHGFPEPPIPPGLSPEAAYGFQLQMWGTKRLEKRLSMLPTEASQVARHAELKALLGAVDDKVEGQSRKNGLLAHITAFVDANPALKTALIQTLVSLLGLVGLASTAYVTFHFGGFASTPTPIQVAQPVVIQQQAPVPEDATPPESLYSSTPTK